MKNKYDAKEKDLDALKKAAHTNMLQGAIECYRISIAHSRESQKKADRKRK